MNFQPPRGPSPRVLRVPAPENDQISRIPAPGARDRPHPQKKSANPPPTATRKYVDIHLYRVIPLAGIETKDQNVCDAPRCRMVSRPCRTDLSSSGRSVGHVERSCPAQSLRSVRSFSTLMSMGQVDRTFEVNGSCRSISHIGQVGSVGQVSHIGQFFQVGRSCRSVY